MTYAKAYLVSSVLLKEEESYVVTDCLIEETKYMQVINQMRVNIERACILAVSNGYLNITRKLHSNVLLMMETYLYKC